MDQVSRAPLPVWIRASLGGLWLLDTLLQAQPGMFSMAMLSGIMQPAAQGQPAWLGALMGWGVQVTTHGVPIWNSAFIAIQAVIALCILVPRPGWNRAGLWISIFWSAAVWVFGEGMGLVLTGAATPLGGAPGAVALYGGVAGLLLAGWGRGRPEPMPWARELVVGLFAAGALAQAAPLYWTGLGLSSVFQGVLAMQPHWLAATMGSVVAVTNSQPVLMNALFVAATAAVAVGVWRRAAWGYALAALWLIFTWWQGEAFGMMLTGMGTDPNTVPLLALLLVASAQKATRTATAPA
ncbi:MAG TPA: hypothetical protein VNM16_01725 [Bacillota bacterium]|nr:hypothetical protein [Bacillota bacterium]